MFHMTPHRLNPAGRKQKGVGAVPRVTVIMTCYNSGDGVRRAIDSVLTQTCSDLELIVVDDASTDSTPEILAEMAANEPRIRVILNERNAGPGIARNTAISEARGQWIAVIDSDDWYEPRRLEVLLDEAERDGAVLIADNQFFVRENTDRPFYQLRPRGVGRVRRLTPYDLVKGDRWGRMANLGLLKPIVKREFLEDCDIRYDEEPCVGEDFYFLLECTQRASYLLFVTEPLYNYQIRKGSLGSSPSVESMIAIRLLHERFTELLQPTVAPSFLQLMEKRARDLDNAIRYKRLIIPIKALDLRRSIIQFLSDPGVAPIVIRMFLLHLSRRMAYLTGVRRQIIGTDGGLWSALQKVIQVLRQDLERSWPAEGGQNEPQALHTGTDDRDAAPSRGRACPGTEGA